MTGEIKEITGMVAELRARPHCQICWETDRDLIFPFDICVKVDGSILDDGNRVLWRCRHGHGHDAGWKFVNIYTGMPMNIPREEMATARINWLMEDRKEVAQNIMRAEAELLLASSDMKEVRGRLRRLGKMLIAVGETLSKWGGMINRTPNEWLFLIPVLTKEK